MVFEFPELQGTMGGIYAREEGAAGAGLEGDLLPVPADRRRSRCAADARAARRGGASRWAARVAGRQARHLRRAVRGRREGDRLARSVRAAPPGAGCGPDPDGPAGADRHRSRDLARRAARRRRRRGRRRRGRGRGDCRGGAGVRARARPLRARAARLPGRSRAGGDASAATCGRCARAGSPKRSRRCARRRTSRRWPSCSSA